MNVSEILIKWYQSHKRDLPWRESGNPYFIWLSEIVLQQTRVQQGIAYYYRFIKAYPTVKDLAFAPLDDVLKNWQGLGYYSRARNLHKAANIIVKEFGGNFPNNFKDLLKLPGVGEYSAGAIASLAYNLPHPAVDGNVYRVLSRLFGISTPIDSSKGKKEFVRVAAEILDEHNAGMHNQAMIELGALICLPRSPKCNACVLKDMCVARQTNSQLNFPVKERAVKVRNRYLYYIVLYSGARIIIRQRSTGDIWAMLYDFPSIEFPEKTNVEKLMCSQQWDELLQDQEIKVNKISEEFRHQLSHQLLHVVFIEVELSQPDRVIDGQEVNFSELEKYAFPRLIEKYFASSSLFQA